MADLHGFDASQIEPRRTHALIPSGKYIAEIIESETGPTRGGGGTVLRLRFRIVQGPYEGRTLLAWLNINNPNEAAMHIGLRHLGDICRAVGVLKPKDSEELHYLRLQIDVRWGNRKDTGEAVNEIHGYSAEPRVAATDPISAKPPWERTN